MIDVWSVYALVRADFLERTRRYSFVATIVVTLVGGAFLIPARNAGYETVFIDGYRGIYNSAWVGASYTLLASMLLSLFGFYLIKNAVELDRTTRVGEIIAATPVKRFDYSLGKVLSNSLLLTSITAILLVTAVAMQFVRGESMTLHLAQIGEPFAIVVPPLVAVIAAIAVLFEMIPWLRGGLGNVIYFFAWTAYLAWTFQANLKAAWWRDLLGANLVIRQVFSTIGRIDSRARPDSIEIGTTIGARVHRYFTFAGFHWTTVDVTGRFAWLAVAVAIAAAAALLFDRFSKPVRSAESRWRNVFADRWRSAIEQHTTPAIDLIFGSDFGAIVLAELRLLVRGATFWWYVVAVGFWVFQLFADPKLQSIAVGLAWIWPMLMWSQLGTREHFYATEQLIFPTVHPIRRQFLAQWLAAVILALVLASGALIHCGLSGNLGCIEGILAGAIFVPTLALACGALSGTTRLFEIVYLVLWYLGPMNRTLFDFTQAPNALGFTCASVALMALAISARRLRLQVA